MMYDVFFNNFKETYEKKKKLKNNKSWSSLTAIIGFFSINIVEYHSQSNLTSVRT